MAAPGSVNVTVGINGSSPARFILRGASEVRGDLKPGQEIIIQGSDEGNAKVTVEDGFTNEGTITIDNTSDQAFAADFTVNGGPLINKG